MIRSLLGGSLLMPAILSELLADQQRPSTPLDPLAPRPPHFPGKARRVIFLYMSGGVSHVDSFDHKPRLFSDAGKEIPEEVKQQMAEAAKRRAEREAAAHSGDGS